MPRSPFATVILATTIAVTGACSSTDARSEASALSKDPTLVSKLETSGDVQPSLSNVALPAACGDIARPARASDDDRQRAAALAHRGYQAELLGDVAEARRLLLEAARLDATDPDAAYHLGRTQETLGDQAAASAAYCRFLVVAPAAPTANDARARIEALAATGVRAARPLPPRTLGAAARVRIPVDRRLRAERAAGSVASATTERATPTVTRSRPARTVTRRVDAGAAGPTSEAKPAASAPAPVASGAGPSAATPPVVAPPTVERETPTTDVPRAEPQVVSPRPTPAPSRSTSSRSTATGAVIGAAAGGAIGAVLGRSTKSGVIGAAAGGILGAVIGSRRP